MVKGDLDCAKFHAFLSKIILSDTICTSYKDIAVIEMVDFVFFSNVQASYSYSPYFLETIRFSTCFQFFPNHSSFVFPKKIIFT